MSMETLYFHDFNAIVSHIKIVKKIVPTEATAEFATRGFLMEATITNPTAGDLDVALYDTEDIYLFPNITLRPSQMLSYNGIRLMHGVIWAASAPGLSGYMRFHEL